MQDLKDRLALLERPDKAMYQLDNSNSNYKLFYNELFSGTYENALATVIAMEDIHVSIKVSLEANKTLANRVASYPPLADQLDMQYHDSINGTTVWLDLITSIKANNPI